MVVWCQATPNTLRNIKKLSSEYPERIKVFLSGMLRCQATKNTLKIKKMAK
jgi:hypothetical protein